MRRPLQNGAEPFRPHPGLVVTIVLGVGTPLSCSALEVANLFAALAMASGGLMTGMPFCTSRLQHLKAKGDIDCAPSAQITNHQAVQIQEIDAAALKNEIAADGGDKL